jgi:hypothetical protein
MYELARSLCFVLRSGEAERLLVELGRVVRGIEEPSMQVAVDDARGELCDLGDVRAQHLQARLTRQPLWNRHHRAEHECRGECHDPEGPWNELAQVATHRWWLFLHTAPGPQSKTRGDALARGVLDR